MKHPKILKISSHVETSDIIAIEGIVAFESVERTSALYAPIALDILNQTFTMCPLELILLESDRDVQHYTLILVDTTRFKEESLYRTFVFEVHLGTLPAVEMKYQALNFESAESMLERSIIACDSYELLEIR